MFGWISVALIASALLGATIFLVRRAAQRWWDYLILLALAALLFRPLYDLVSGDVSRVLPDFIWSDGFDGKDQIIFASVASTIFLPLIVSAIIAIAIRLLTVLVRKSRG